MYRDNVKCCNCNFDGLVDLGEETCPSCDFTGALAWKDGQDQEMLV